MTGMKRILVWCCLLCKRLYKKPTFLVLLAMIPLLVLGYGMSSREESGMLTIALASRTAQVEPLTQKVWQHLQQSEVISYICCESPEEAAALVREGKANVAWVFEEDIEHKIYDFVARRTRANAFITILEPENRTMLKLVREVISGVMFPYCSEAVYLTYIRQNAPELAQLTDAQLLEYYRNAAFTDGLFEFTDIQGNVTQESDSQPSYLLAPVRGMLAVVVLLSGLATAMYYLHDMQQGTFAWMPQRRHFWVELGYQLISILNVLAVVLLALKLTGQLNPLTRELPAAGMFALCAAAFAMLVRRLSGGIRGLGMVTPILVVVMLVICPVFFDLGALRKLQLLLPPTYFVNASYQSSYLWQMGGYTLVLLVLCALFDRVRQLLRTA